MEERRAEVPSLRAEAMVKVGGWMKDRERGRRRKEKRKEEKEDNNIRGEKEAGQAWWEWKNELPAQCVIYCSIWPYYVFPVTSR